MDVPSEMKAVERFEWIVRALAQDYPEQAKLFPSFVCVADDLALEFESRLQLLDEGALRADARSLALSLDSRLESMSESKSAQLWDDEALKRAPEWEEVRELARRLAGLAGWSLTAPGPIDGAYTPAR